MGLLSAVTGALSRLRAAVYDAVIVPMTTAWYRAVLLEVPVGARVLDVGIGTAASLLRNRDLLLSKGIRVTGVDYDADYVRRAREAVRRADPPALAAAVSVVHCSIHEFDPARLPPAPAGEEEKGSKGATAAANAAAPFDVVYFSGSFMIIPDKAAALRRCVSMLADGGAVFFTQTFERPPRTALGRRAMPLVKRALRALTTIDFGDVTYEADFVRVLAEAGVAVRRKRVLRGGFFREQVMIVAAPAA